MSHRAILKRSAYLSPIAAISLLYSSGCTPNSGSTSEWNPNWDLRGNRAPIDHPSTASGNKTDTERTIPPKKKQASHQLVLIRHGQYEFGTNDHNKILTSLGKIQAQKTGLRIKDLTNAKKIFP